MITYCMEEIEKKSNDLFMASITNFNNDIELIMLYKKTDKLLLYSPTNNYSDEILKFATNEIYKYEKNYQE